MLRQGARLLAPGSATRGRAGDCTTLVGPLDLDANGTVAPATARASSVLVTVLDTAAVLDEMGSDQPAKARASSVLEMAPSTGALTAVACVRMFGASARASSLLVGSGFARATVPAAPESKSAAPSERPSFEILWLVFSI